MLSQGRYLQRDTLSLSNNKMDKRSRSKGTQVMKVKADCFGLKRMLDCVDQEWRIQYIHAADYLYQSTHKRRRLWNKQEYNE